MLTVALSNQNGLVPVYQGTQKQQMTTNVKLCPCLVSELKLTLKHSSSSDCIGIVADRPLCFHLTLQNHFTLEQLLRYKNLPGRIFFFLGFSVTLNHTEVLASFSFSMHI